MASFYHSALLLIGLLYSGLVQGQQQDEEVPAITDGFFSFDLNDQKGKIMEYLNFVDEDEARELLKVWEIFDIEWKHIALGAISVKARDVFNKKKKKIKLLQSEAYLWLEHMLVSGQLQKFLKKAYQVYNLIVDREKKLHDKFLEGLGLVSSGVINSQVAIAYVSNVIIAINRINQFKQLLEDNQLLLSAEEYAFMLSALANALDYQQDVTDEYELITTDNKLEMTDGQRLKALEKFNKVTMQTNRQIVKLTELLNYLLASRAGRAGELNNLESLITTP